MVTGTLVLDNLAKYLGNILARGKDNIGDTPLISNKKEK